MRRFGAVRSSNANADQSACDSASDGVVAVRCGGDEQVERHAVAVQATDGELRVVFVAAINRLFDPPT
jgi:hypothetical protein